MTEIDGSLQRMGFAQLALLLGFGVAYVLAIGALLGARGRARSALLALALAAGFIALCEPWVHGALLVAFAVAAIGIFAAASWLLARMVTRQPVPAPTPVPIDAERPEALPQSRGRRLAGAVRRVSP
jgi:hypothetical protein